MLRVLIAGIALACVACGGAPEPEPARCRDPAGIFFEQVERVSTCGDDRIERPTEDCMHTIGTFNRETCEVQATFVCSGGVTASLAYMFPAGEGAYGFEVFRRIEDGCRVELTMVEDP